MLRDITIGQYYGVDSPVHGLDPRVKLFGVMAFVLSLFLFHGPVVYGVAGVALLLAIFASRVPLGYLFRGLKPLALLMLFTALLNLFLTPGTTLVSLGVLAITREGCQAALRIAIRLTMLVAASSLLTLTTTPTRLTDALEKVMGPLARLGMPVHEIAMMTSIALRFIPILIEELDKIMKAQTARGVDFETGGIGKRMKNLMPILIPLFVSAIRRANDLALAMESRCYRGGEGRTKMKPLQYERQDYVAYGVIALYLCIVLAAQLFTGPVVFG